MLPVLATMFVLVLTVFQPGKGPVTTTSAPMDIDACHAQMVVGMTLAGDKLVSIHCDEAK